MVLVPKRNRTANLPRFKVLGLKSFRVLDSGLSPENLNPKPQMISVKTPAKEC